MMGRNYLSFRISKLRRIRYTDRSGFSKQRIFLKMRSDTDRKWVQTVWDYSLFTYGLVQMNACAVIFQGG